MQQTPRWTAGGIPLLQAGSGRRNRAAYVEESALPTTWTPPMSGNATHRFRNTSVLTVQTADAPQVVTSDDLDGQLVDTYQRVGLRPGLLERLCGIRERRWWADGVTFVDGAAMAG